MARAAARRRGVLATVLAPGGRLLLADGVVVAAAGLRAVRRSVVPGLWDGVEVSVAAAA